MRSGFTSRMRFERDSDTTTPIRWYRVPLDRAVLDLPTPFRSSIWDDDDLPVDLGEVASSREWWNGGPAPLVPVGVPGRCGTPDQWLNGVSATDPQPAIDPNTGAPVCCGKVALIGLGGIAEGGHDAKRRLAEAEALQAQVCLFWKAQAAEADGMAAQVCFHAWEELPEADALAAAELPPSLTPALPEADALDAVIVIPFAPRELPEADGFGVVYHAPIRSTAQLPEADGFGVVYHAPIRSTAALPEADGFDSVAIFPNTPQLGEGCGLDAVVTYSGFAPTPGPDCLHALDVHGSFTYEESIGPGDQHWYKFTPSPFVPYHVTQEFRSGDFGVANVYSGTCAGLTLLGTADWHATNCFSFTVFPGTTIYVVIFGDLITSGVYWLDINPGGC